MSNKISKTDVTDNEFVDAIELASDGYFAYRSGNLVSTIAITKIVKINSSGYLDRLNLVDEPLEVEDRVYIFNGSIDGYYTVSSILDSERFTVYETLANSTGGIIKYLHPPGASKVGVDPSRLRFTEEIDVQAALEDLDGYITPKPTEIGQFLYAVDSENLVFVAAKPVVNDDGFILTNDDGIVVVN